MSLEDIEVVNLERVGFNLKNFDMAIVFKVGGGGCGEGVMGWRMSELAGACTHAHMHAGA